MKKYIPLVVGAIPGFSILVFCFIVAAIGKPICFFGSVVCFVRPEWWCKLFGCG